MQRRRPVDNAREHVNRAQALLDEIAAVPYGQRDGRQLQLLYQAIVEQQAALADLAEWLYPQAPPRSTPRMHSSETR